MLIDVLYILVFCALFSSVVTIAAAMLSSRISNKENQIESK